jgi:hypothetical protein
MKDLKLMQELSAGQHFYTEEKPNTVKSYASLWKVKTATEIVFCLSDTRSELPKCNRLTKVTILQHETDSNIEAQEG